MSISVSVALLDPDLTIFHGFCKSLKEFTPHLKELIVVDNASEDKSYKYILENIFPDKHKIIENQKNVGYGQAHNQSIQIAEGDYFVVCNDDIEFFNFWSEKMMEALKDPNLAQIGPINGVCNKWNSESLGYGDDKGEPDYIEGSLFMMRTELARRYGPFDPIYSYGYYEDGDLSLRLKKDGYYIKQIPVEWKHYRAKTTNRLIEETDVYGYQVLNRRIFDSRWYSYVIAKKFGPVVVIKRAGSYGDVFLATPILKMFRDILGKDAALIIMTVVREAILLSDYVDAITQMGTPIFADYFIDLDYAYEKDFKGIHIVDAYYRETLRQIKEQFPGDVTYWNKFQDYKIDYHGFLRGLKDDSPELRKYLPEDFDQYVLVDVGETWSGKKWPDEHYMELIDKLRADGVKIALTGVNQSNAPFKYDKSFASALSIEKTMYLMKAAKLYISHEGLLSHLCQALDKPAVTMYMCTLPEYTADVSKIGKTLFPVTSKLVCKGCRHVGQTAGTTIICTRNYECCKSISVDEVYKKVKETLDFLDRKPDSMV